MHFTKYFLNIEISHRIGQSTERTPHCIKSTETECDLTAELKNLKASYKADVLSEPARGVTSDLIEHPYTTSERFSPYLDSQYPALIFWNWPFVNDVKVYKESI